MVIKENLEKKRIYFFIFVLVSVLLIGAVMAYGTNNPQIFGHSAGEIEGSSGRSYWSLSGNEIYNNNLGNVEIRPSNVNVYPLSIRGIAFPNSKTLEWIALENQSGDSKWHINYYNATATSGPKGINFVESGVADFRLFLADGGKVGIGTPNPKGKLHVVSGDIVLGNDENGQKFVIHPRSDSEGDYLHITSDDPNGNWDWNKGIIFLRSTGNVGIGMNPSYKLDVNGIARANDFCTTSGTCLGGAGGGSQQGAYNLIKYPLYIGDINDANHQLVYDNTVDGPQLRGNLGGRLTINQGGLREILKWNLSGVKISGELDMNNNRITNVATPIASSPESDVATKGYVDSKSALGSCRVYQQNMVLQPPANGVSYTCPQTPQSGQPARPWVLYGGCSFSTAAVTGVLGGTGQFWDNPSTDGKSWECGSYQWIGVTSIQMRVACCSNIPIQ